MEEHYREVVRLAELADSQSMIRGHVFIDCEVLGPAIVAPIKGTAFVRCSFDTPDPEAMFWEVPENAARVGMIGLVDTSFTGCRISNVGIAGTAKTLQPWRENASGDH